MGASQNVRPNPSKVAGSSAPTNGIGHSLPFNTQTFDQDKSLETNFLAGHQGMEVNDSSIRHAPPRYNSVSSRRAMTESHRNRSNEGLFDGSETVSAAVDTTRSRWKHPDPHVSFDKIDSSASGLPHASETSDVNPPDSISLLYANHGPRPRDLPTINDFKKSRTNHGYTENPISAAVQDIPKIFGIERVSDLRDQMLWTGQIQGSPMMNTGSSRKSHQ